MIACNAVDFSNHKMILNQSADRAGRIWLDNQGDQVHLQLRAVNQIDIVDEGGRTVVQMFTGFSVNA